MSWLKKNYEKTFLIGSAALLVGVVSYTLKSNGVAKSKRGNTSVNEVIPNPYLADVASAIASLEVENSYEMKTEGVRKINLFVGQLLYKKKGINKMVDVLVDAPVHEGINNSWWSENGIDITFQNAPEQDMDKDGYTNREEYDAGTDPTSLESYPDLINKLELVEVKTFRMRFSWSAFSEDKVSLRYIDSKREALRDIVTVGSNFFEKSKNVENRFILKNWIEKAVDEKGFEQEAYEIVDRTPEYKGTLKERFRIFRRGIIDNRWTEVADRSVRLRLNALGKELEVFEVKEHFSFSLPNVEDGKMGSSKYKIEKIDKIGTIYKVTVSFKSDKGEVQNKVLKSIKK